MESTLSRLKLGEQGEIEVLNILNTKGLKGRLNKPQGKGGNHIPGDIILDNGILIEVKTVNYSSGWRCSWCKDLTYKRWLVEHKRLTSWDFVILRCLSTPPCHFIIPRDFFKPLQRGFGIRAVDPWEYNGKFSQYRESWELIKL